MKPKQLALALFLVLLLLPLSSARQLEVPTFIELGEHYFKVNIAGCEPPAGISNLSERWIELSVIAILFSVSIIAFSYMVSIPLGAAKVQAWAKNELYQTFGSAVIIILFFFAFQTVDTLVNEQFGGGAGSDSITSAIDYAYNMKMWLITEYTAVIVMNGVLAIISSLTVNLSPGKIAGIHFSGATIAKPFMDALNIILRALIMAIGSWQIKEVLLCFAKREMLAVFMPVGILLRSFPFTRKAGGAMIAVALAFYFVYPIMLNINKIIVYTHYGVYDSQGTLGNLDAHMEKFWDSMSLRGLPTFKWFGIMAIAALLLNSTIVATLTISLVIPMLLYVAEEVVYAVLIASIVLPAINIFVVLTFTRESAKYLGVDLNLGTLMQLI